MSNHRLLDALLELPEPERLTALRGLSEEERRELRYHWRLWARQRQLPPPGDWTTWLVMAGRGFGKTRAGAEWVRMVCQAQPDARFALVGASLGEVRAVMVEGESGILATCPPGQVPVFESSLRRLTWGNGAQATLYSAGEPESLRGPQHSHARRTGAKGRFHQRGNRPVGRSAVCRCRGRTGSPPPLLRRTARAGSLAMTPQMPGPAGLARSHRAKPATGCSHCPFSE